MIATNERWLTPPAIARQLGVTNDKVLSWIRSGRLKAVNLSDGDRPRWKISPADLQVFLDTRSNQVSTKPPRTRRAIPKPTKIWV